MYLVFNRCILVIVLCLLAGCGFKLRGNYNIPEVFQRLSVISETLHDPFANKIIRALKQNNITVLTTSSDDVPKLYISKYKLTQTILSYNMKGQPDSVNLILSFEYTITKNGKTLKPSAIVTKSLTYIINPNQPILNQSETATREKELQQKAIQVMLRQISKHTNST